MKKNNSSDLKTCPPNLCTNAAEASNSSNSSISENDTNVFSSQDEELLSILQDLKFFKTRHLRQIVAVGGLVSTSIYTWIPLKFEGFDSYINKYS